MAVTAAAQATPTGSTQPRLLVSIVVDQLRSDYIDLLQSHFTQQGFNRLLRAGACFENIDFGCAGLDIASGTAVAMTGAYPNVNGIPQAHTYDPATRRAQPVLNDPGKIGNFTSETLSPAALRVSTLADEVRVSNDGLGHVYSIAADAQQAILLAGHAANSAFWINDVDGRWSTTTYYSEVPKCLQSRNYQQPLSNRLPAMAWEPLLELDRYTEIPETKRYYRFRYNFPSSDKDCYRSFKSSALSNEEVTDVAADYLRSLKLGTRGQLDMLAIGYTAAPYPYSKQSYNLFELHDTYLRLDAQLARLFEAIDATAGLQNTVVLLTSTGYFNDSQSVDPKYNIPGGEFRPERAMSLLNIYLMALYGNGQWVDGYYDRRFYLNRDLIKERKLELSAIRSLASQFLRQMSGVSAAYTFEEILNNPVNDQLRALNRMMTPATQGDVVIAVTPGWTIVETDGANTKTTQIRANAVTTPAFIMAPGVKPQRITAATQATILAPTVARLLRIRAPNAAAEMPLPLQ